MCPGVNSIAARAQPRSVKMQIQENRNRYSKAFELYVLPLILLVCGIALITQAFTTSFPEPNSLSEVSGHLSSYSFYQTGRGKGDYKTIISLQEGTRCWTNAIYKNDAEFIFKRRGQEVRYYVDPHSTKRMDRDVVKAYGLWIDGKEIQSVEETIKHDKANARFWSPAIGIFSIGVGVFIYRRMKAKYTQYG